MSKDIFVQVNDCLRYLDKAGWPELINSQYENDVVKELKLKFPNITDEVIEKVLELVLV